MKNVSKNVKAADKTTSVRLTPIALRQLDELSKFLGENASRVIIRSLCLLHEKYLGGSNNESKAKTAR